MKKLSNREKLLLFVLVVVVLVGLMMRFVLMPNLEQLGQNRALVAEYKAKQEEMLNEIANYDEWKMKVAEKEEELKKNTFFAKSMDDVTVDMLVQKLAKENNLEIISSDIYDPRLENIREFVVQQPFLTYPIREEKIKFDEEAAKVYENERAHALVEGTQEETDAVSDRSVPVIRNTIMVAGNTENMLNFVDAVGKLGQSIYVADVESTITGGVLAGKITIDVYYIH